MRYITRQTFYLRRRRHKVIVCFVTLRNGLFNKFNTMWHCRLAKLFGAVYPLIASNPNVQGANFTARNTFHALSLEERLVLSIVSLGRFI